MNRVGVVSGTETWMGAENCRKLAVARLRSTDEADDASSVVVGMQGLSDAIDCRRRSKASC